MAQQPTVRTACRFVDNNRVCLCPGLDTAVYADSPFNQLKAALNSESHFVNERDIVSLTSAALSAVIATPASLASFIQATFTLQDGSRISDGQAIALAAHARGILLPRGTCAIALPTVQRILLTTVDRCRALLTFPHCVAVSGTTYRYGGVCL